MLRESAPTDPVFQNTICNPLLLSLPLSQYTGTLLIPLSGMYYYCVLSVVLRLIVVAEHTSWLGRPQVSLPLILFWRCLLLITAILWTLFPSLSSPFFPASPGRSRKVLGQKSPISRAPRERPKNFCENWMTVYSGHKVIVGVHTTRRKFIASTVH